LYFPSGLVAIVVVVIPITVGVPATAVFIPPSMVPVPASLPRLAQFEAGAFRLPAVPAMMLDGFMQFVIGLVYAALATIVTLAGCCRWTGECQQPEQCGRGQRQSGSGLLPSRWYGHGTSVVCPLLDGDFGLKLIKHSGGENVASLGPHPKNLKIRALLQQESQ